MSADATRYCKLCGFGPREWMECEEPDCVIETQAEANARAAQGTETGTAKTDGLGPKDDGPVPAGHAPQSGSNPTPNSKEG